MDKNKFEELMEAYGVAYITYVPEIPPTNGKKTTFTVATTDFKDAYIQKAMQANKAKYGVLTPPVKEGEVLVFSYSKDRFRTIPLARIKGISSLESELRRA